ncbi:unnamed protein product [Cercospora beticola]|nr:unnamed protein product [Cercospora beticola]
MATWALNQRDTKRMGCQLESDDSCWRLISVPRSLVVRNWGRAMGNMDKVPSVISYSSPGEPEWGSNISGDALTLINQKLELELQEERVDELGLTLRVLNGTRGLSFDHIRDAGPNPDFPCSTPEQIVTDYLRQVFQCTRDAIKVKELGRTSTPVDLVVTMPVTWSYQARNAVFRAATAAGFNSTGIPSLRETILVSEPEAAAYYTARECGAGLLKENRCFVICDAGGGTVDSVAYRVTQLRPHLQLERVTKPTGSKCGSALIDTEFKRWLRRVIGEQNYAMLDPDAARQKATNAYEMESPAMRKLIKEFFVAKSTFKNYERSRRAAIKIELPEPLDKLTIENRVDEGALIIKWKGMKQLMDKCVNPAVALVRKQIEAVGSSRGTEVKTVFLVGGFGASPYLQEELRSSFELMDVTVFHPPKDS